MAAGAPERAGWRVVPAALAAAALLAMIAGQAGGGPARVALAGAGDALKQQQQQALELREVERDWGAHIQALAGRGGAPGAARLQALAGRPRTGPGPNFEAMRAAGEARLQALVESGAPARAHEWDARIGKVERTYKKLVAEQRKDTFLKEQTVQKIFAREMEKLKREGRQEDARLRRDEENAETTILAEKKEDEIKRQLEAVQEAAKAKARHLQAQLDAARRLARKYQLAVSSDKLPKGVHVDLPKDLFPSVDKGGNATAGSVLDQMTAAAEADERKAAAAATAAHKAELEHEKRVAARAKARAEAAEQAAEAAKKAAERKQRREKEAQEEAQRKAREAAERKKRDEERAEQAKARAAAAQARAAKLEAAKKKEEARALRCTDDNCPLSTMDKVTVVDGDSIQKMEERAENGRGKDKLQALAMIRQLQSKIKRDFQAVTGFAQHQVPLSVLARFRFVAHTPVLTPVLTRRALCGQEHILDVKKVSKDTTFMLGQKVELSLIRKHGRSPSSFPPCCLLPPDCPGALHTWSRCQG